MKTLVGVLFLEKMGDVRSAKIVYGEIDETKSDRNQTFQALRAAAIPKDGKFIGSFAEEGEFMGLIRP